MPRQATSSILQIVATLAILCPLTLMAAAPARSTWRIQESQPLDSDGTAEIKVRATGSGKSVDQSTRLPLRAIVKGSDGEFHDGSGHGVYADGRFFAEGEFTVEVPPGETTIELRSGPNYVPLTIRVTAEAGRRLVIEAVLHQWFRPENRGWYAGDNHVHAQHDATAAIKTGLDYTALQGRANGLSYITEAGSEISYADLERLNTSRFLLRFAPEIRPGPFIGHLNTPGIAGPVSGLSDLCRRPLPVQAIKAEVHRAGGVVIHSHPLTPPYQLHWMGATEILSDAVLGNCADLLDLDSPACEQLWFTVLNLDNRVAASSYTDAALGRKQTLSPGDRRVYCRADRLEYATIVDGLRRGRTMATNGGPLFAFVNVGGASAGDEFERPLSGKIEAQVEIQALHPLRRAELYRRGRVDKSFDVVGRTGQIDLTASLDVPQGSGNWYVFRAEDEQRNWVITSPIYMVEPRSNQKVEPARPAATMLLLEISNAERFIKLRREFFAHLIVTVSPEESIAAVELLKDGVTVQRFTPQQGDQLGGGKTPVTELNGPYAPGWIWHPRPEQAVHLQADWPVRETGWYAIRVSTSSRQHRQSDAIHFDAANPKSHATSLANLEAMRTFLRWRGYGEEMPLADVQEPFQGDHWWYPLNTYWSLETVFDEDRKEVSGGSPEHAARFRNRTEDP